MSDEALRERVREVVDTRGGTRRGFAAAIGLDETKLSKALAGRRRFTAAELAAIARHGEVSATWLLDGDGDGDGDGPHEGDGAGVTAIPAPVVRRAVRADPDGARGRILHAAWALIAERGFHRVRVADVATAAGTSSAAVHYHFEDKDTLLTEALRHNVELAFARQSAALADVPDPRERLLRLLDLQTPDGPVLEPEWSIWMQVWAEAVVDAGRRDLYAQAQDRWYRTVLMTLRAGAHDGVLDDRDLELRARQLTALVDGLGVGVMTRACALDDMRAALRAFVDTL